MEKSMRGIIRIAPAPVKLFCHKKLTAFGALIFIFIVDTRGPAMLHL
jgi:hypothetical protein